MERPAVIAPMAQKGRIMAENQNEGPARMAKWAELTETIHNQIGESREHVDLLRGKVAELKDKISFILLIPPPPPPPPPPAALAAKEEPTEEVGDAPSKHIGGSPEESALTAKLGDISNRLVALNADDMRELFSLIDNLTELVDI